MIIEESVYKKRVSNTSNGRHVKMKHAQMNFFLEKFKIKSWKQRENL